jgi:hypothetical protein
MDVQTMTINGHLLLLVVATGLFVRVWNANDQSRSRMVMRTQSQTAVACPPNPVPVTNRTAVVHQPDSVSVTTTAQAEEVWTAANCPIPLPAGITAGNYRVVDDTGRVARLEIAASSDVIAVANPREVSADFHLMSVDNRRWYFIRLQSPIALDVRDDASNSVGDALPEIESNACPFLNRKFDFSGYVTSSLSDESVIDETVIEEIARPDPPELPVSR